MNKIENTYLGILAGYINLYEQNLRYDPWDFVSLFSFLSALFSFKFLSAFFLSPFCAPFSFDMMYFGFM
jgi:hypothetical protein